MDELIARLEAATEGDRELDAAIWLTTSEGATRKKWSYTHTATGRICEVDETRDASHRLITVPSFSTSLDAALKLVPEGWDWSMSRHDRSPKGEFFATVREINNSRKQSSWRDAEGTSHSATAPLALCIAALRARSHTAVPAAPERGPAAPQEK